MDVTFYHAHGQAERQLFGNAPKMDYNIRVLCEDVDYSNVCFDRDQRWTLMRTVFNQD